jgi:hypothetical protein
MNHKDITSPFATVALKRSATTTKATFVAWGNYSFMNPYTDNNGSYTFNPSDTIIGATLRARICTVGVEDGQYKVQVTTN